MIYYFCHGNCFYSTLKSFYLEFLVYRFYLFYPSYLYNFYTITSFPNFMLLGFFVLPKI